MSKHLKKPRITKQLPLLFAFFQEMEARGKRFTAADIAAATGYPLKGTVKAKLSRGEWNRFLQEVENDKYIAKGTRRIDLEQFAYRISSGYRHRAINRALRPKSEADMLLEGSAHEFQLAIELFNRPTTPNRVEAFVVHFVNAWEKLLKAQLINQDGSDSIWQAGKERRSISLRVALERLYAPTDTVRLNIQFIEDLRDDATHYMLPALDAIASRYFQSGVMNFFREFKAIAGRVPIEMKGVGLMSLVVDARQHSRASLTMQFGMERARKILRTIHQLEKAAIETDDPSFAIPLHLSVGFVDKRAHPEQTIAGLSGMTSVVVNKTVDPKKSHPHEAKQVVAEVNKRLHAKFNDDALRKLMTRTKPEFNIHDFSSISSAEGWKRDSNAFHFDHGTIVQHTYSDACIDLIVEKLTKQPDYLIRAKKKETEKRQRKK